MNNEPLESIEETPHRSWLDRISQVFTHEPKDKPALVEILKDATERQVIDNNSLNMIEGVIKIADLRVRDIMIPRSQMIVIEAATSLKDIVGLLVKTVHSRFPVIGENKDEILGVLLAKDLLAYSFTASTKPFAISEILRPTFYVPESKRLDVLLNEFRLNRNHMAIVVDEYGGVVGLITIEDVLEEIVGDIEDEYDVDDEHFIKPYIEDSFAVNALTPLLDFNRYFKTKLEDKEVETIGGLVMRSFGHLPKRGETITITDFTFKILRADKRRIHLLQATKINTNHN